MTQQAGANAKLVWGLESVFKTSPADGYNMPFNSCALKANRALNSAATITGNRNPVMPFSGNKIINGSIVIPIDANAMMYWAKAMFGAGTDAGSAGAYTHTYKIGATMPSITLENQFPDLTTPRYGLFNGCRISSFSTTFGGDGELVATLGIVGAKYTEGTSPFDASVAATTLARVNNFEAVILEGGSGISIVREMSVNIDFGLDAAEYCIGGGGELGDIPVGICKVSGNLKTLFTDGALLTKGLNSTESSLKCTVTHAAGAVFEMELQELFYELNSPDIPGPQGMIVDINFQGFYDNGAGASAAIMKLTNTTQTSP